MVRSEAAKLRRAYRSHRDSARKRRIEFLFTFDEWLDIWLRSGKLAQRGCRRGKYVMARHGDRGPYSIDNVSIITSERNSADIWRNNPALMREASKKLGDAMRGRIPHNKGVPHTEETKLKMRVAKVGWKAPWAVERTRLLGLANKGRKWTKEQKANLTAARLSRKHKHSSATIEKMSTARRAYWQRRHLDQN